MTDCDLVSEKCSCKALLQRPNRLGGALDVSHLGALCLTAPCGTTIGCVASGDDFGVRMTVDPVLLQIQVRTPCSALAQDMSGLLLARLDSSKAMNN